MNKFIIVGTLTREPREFNEKQHYLSVFQTSGHNKNYFGVYIASSSISPVLQYLKRGTKVILEGYLNQKSEKDEKSLVATFLQMT